MVLDNCATLVKGMAENCRNPKLAKYLHRPNVLWPVHTNEFRHEFCPVDKQIKQIVHSDLGQFEHDMKRIPHYIIYDHASRARMNTMLT